MVKDGSRDIIRAHALSDALRELEEACLAGDLGPEEFLHRADGELTRLRELLAQAPAPGASGSGERVCRAQARELDSFRKQLAAELAVIRTAYAEAQPLPPLGADPLAPGPDVPGDGFGSAAGRPTRGAASGGLAPGLELEDDDRLGPAGPAAAPGAGPAFGPALDFSLELEPDAAPGPATPPPAAQPARRLDAIPDLGLELETDPGAHAKPIRRVSLDDDIPAPAPASAPGRAPEPRPEPGLGFGLEPDAAPGPAPSPGAAADRGPGAGRVPDAEPDAFPGPESLADREPEPDRDFAPEFAPPAFTPDFAPDLAPEAGPDDDQDLDQDLGPAFGLPPLPAWAPPEHEAPGAAAARTLAPGPQPASPAFGSWAGDDAAPAPLAPGGSCPIPGLRAVLADDEPGDDEEPLTLGAPVAAAPGPDPDQEVSRPPRGLDLLWDADLPDGPDGPQPGSVSGPAFGPDSGLDAEEASGLVPPLGRRAGARPAEQAPAPGGTLPQGILRALHHAGAEPGPAPQGGSGLLRPRPAGTAGIPSLRRPASEGAAPPAPGRTPGAGVPSLRRPAPADAAPPAPRPSGAPAPGPAKGPATSPATGPAKGPAKGLRLPQDDAPPPARRAAPLVKAPVKSRVIVTGSATWETTDDDMALQMFVPGSQLDMARPASAAEQLLGAVGRTPEGEVARQRLARMTRDARQPRKSPGGAAVISLFMAGAGLLYTGSTVLGVLLSLVHVVCAAVVFLTQSPLAVGGMGASSLLGAWLAWCQARELNAQELARREAESLAPVMGASRETSLTERDLHL